MIVMPWDPCFVTVRIYIYMYTAWLSSGFGERAHTHTHTRTHSLQQEKSPQSESARTSLACEHRWKMGAGECSICIYHVYMRCLLS